MADNLSFDIPYKHGAPFQILTISLIWKLAVVILTIINLKSLPLVWHWRLLGSFRFVLPSKRSRYGPTSAELFQPVVTASHVSLMETDYNMHKSNSTYFSDIDIARTQLICTLFSTGIEHARNPESKLIKGGRSMFRIALGAVSCSFRREIKPYEKYEMWTRVLSWDQKWLYVVTHFVRADAVHPRAYSLYPKLRNKRKNFKQIDKAEAVIASALSKCVFKKGRLTIPPETMLRASGLFPPGPVEAAQNREQESLVHAGRNIAAEVLDIPLRACVMMDGLLDATLRHYFPRTHSVCEPTDDPRELKRGWTWEEIDCERRRGFELAQKLAGLDRLDQEFSAEAEALGRHDDLGWLLGLP